MSTSIDASAVLQWLWRASWESAVLALLVLAVQALLRRKLGAQWVFAFWWLVILRLLLPASIPTQWSPFNLFSAKPKAFVSAPTPAPDVTRLASTPPTVFNYASLSVPDPASLDSPYKDSIDSLYRILIVVWLTGMAVFAARLCLGKLRLSRILRSSTEVKEQKVVDLLQECARMMRLKRSPRLVLNRHFESPAVVGCRRPTLVMPEPLVGSLSRQELRHVFLHELAHIRRRDLATNWLLCGIETVHWFNPLLRYVFRRIQADRELACDALTLSRMEPGEGPRYGETILKLLERLTRTASSPGLVALLDEKQLVKRRIEMITSKSGKNSLLAAVLFTGLTALAFTGAKSEGASTAVEPVQAQQASDAKPAVDAELLKQDAAIDRQHLERIYGAIRRYYKEHQDLPNWLSDLVPKYLPDAKDLVSPVEQRTGKSVLYGREDPKIHTSYIYEFNGGVAAEEFNKGRAVPLTCKQWKLMQLQKFGMVTPILRSHVDKPVLNVAYSGQIYETGLLWEDDPRTAALIKQDPRLGPQPPTAGGAHVSVHVVDAGTGKGIAGAVVRNGIGSEFGLLLPSEATTDANGDVSVPLGEWKVNFLFLNANQDGYNPAGMEWNREKSQEEAPPAEITLKLTQEKGK